VNAHKNGVESKECGQVKSVNYNQYFFVCLLLFAAMNYAFQAALSDCCKSGVQIKKWMPFYV